MTIKVYQSKVQAFPGTAFEELYPRARKFFNQTKARTKRQPYIKSAYFGKQKVFIELLWVHLDQKNRKERNKRLKFMPCGFDLIRNTRFEPTIKVNPNRKGEKLYRFAGITPRKELFYVQVKENVRTGRKDLMSIFPVN